MAKGTGWLTLILGILVIIFAWATSGQTMQILQSIAGIVVAIVGIMGLKGK